MVNRSGDADPETGRRYGLTRRVESDDALARATRPDRSIQPDRDSRARWRLTGSGKRAQRDARRQEIIRRLLIEAPDRLAVRVYRRLTIDRHMIARSGIADIEDILSWGEIAAWARREGLVDENEGRVLTESSPEPSLFGGEDVEGDRRRRGRSKRSTNRDGVGNRPRRSPRTKDT